MSLKKAAVGPLDLPKFLADVKAGKVAPRTAWVDICVNPEVADRADELADQINELIMKSREAAAAEQSITDSAGSEFDDQIDALEVEHDALLAEYAASTVTFTFRGQGLGDRQAISEALGLASPDEKFDTEEWSVVCTARYCTSHDLTADDVRALIPVIGFAQYAKLAGAWQELAAKTPAAPLSPRRSRGRVTARS